MNVLEKVSCDYARERLAYDDCPEYNDEYELKLAFEAGAEWQLDHPTSDYAWKIYNFIWDYKNAKFGEDLTLQQAIDKYFKDWKQND